MKTYGNIASFRITEATFANLKVEDVVTTPKAWSAGKIKDIKNMIPYVRPENQRFFQDVFLRMKNTANREDQSVEDDPQTKFLRQSRNCLLPFFFFNSIHNFLNFPCSDEFWPSIIVLMSKILVLPVNLIKVQLDWHLGPFDWKSQKCEGKPNCYLY